MFLNELHYQIPNPSIDNQFNFAQSNEFYVIALKVPGVAFYTQEFKLPGITLEGGSIFANRFTDIKVTGSKIGFSTLTLNFIINENHQNYDAVRDWMFGIGFPENNEQFINAVKAGSFSQMDKNIEMALTSQLDVLPLDSNHRPIEVISFHGAFPISLSELPYTTTSTDVEYIKATVVFDYTNYTTEKISYV